MVEGAITPDFILGSAFDGKTVYFLKKDQLEAFFRLHSGQPIFMAHAPFDLLVVEKACGACPVSMIDSDKLIDVLLLGQLVWLSEKGELPERASLDFFTEALLEIKLPKDILDDSGNTIRLSFSQFLNIDGSIRYQEMPETYLRYAGMDAVATYLVAYELRRRVEDICSQHRVRGSQLLSHQIQLKASYALTLVSKYGMHIDQAYRKKVKFDLESSVGQILLVLKECGWQPGEKSNVRLQEILQKLVDDHNLKIPKTATGKINNQAESLQEYLHISFIKNYLEYKKASKLIEFLSGSEERIHPRFRPLVSTGRTASYSPNVQNFPREGNVRQIVAATPGYVILQADYSQIELRALAQITYCRFGCSKMRELLNAKADLHTHFASVLTGKSAIEVTDEDRRKAKACNFGFPGGLGVNSFVQYAKTNYGLTLSSEQANAYLKTWLDTFPEVRGYLDQVSTIEMLADSGDLFDYPFGDRMASESVAAWVFRGIVFGNSQTKAGREFSEEERDWAFSVVKRAEFPGKKKFAKAIALRQGSPKLWKSYISKFTSVVFASGRVRAFTEYCQSKNNPFQGLAADGAKEALFELVKRRYRVINFVHDEVLVEIPLGSDLTTAEKEVRSILIAAMAKHCPDVAIEVDSQWMFHWSKKGTHILDANGNLVEKNASPKNESGSERLNTGRAGAALHADEKGCAL